MKRHGFMLPLHWLQVMAWVGVLTLAVLFFSLTAPSLPATLREVMLSLYAGLLLLVIVFMLKGTIADPTDEAVKRERGVGNGKTLDPRLYPRLCIKCSTHVGARSKHCNRCGRCAADFDHHCDWLNNCVGGVNYRFFVGLIVSLEACCALQLSTTFWLLRLVFEGDTEEVENRHDVGEKGYGFLVTHIVVALVVMTIVICNGYLILFHCYLKLRKMTTYEFIIARRNKKQVVPAYESSRIISTQRPVPIPASDFQDNDVSCASSKQLVSKPANPGEEHSPAISLRNRPTFSRTLDIGLASNTLEEFQEARCYVRKGAAGKSPREFIRSRVRHQSTPASFDNL